MYSFLNDYSEGAHPRILKALYQLNQEQNMGYGKDVHSDRARAYIKKELKKEDVDIHFISGGTQANLLVISSFLRPHECVISADTGHINVHEAGAIEATGHKVLGLPTKDGKLTPQLISKVLRYHKDEHMVKPKMVYISNTTELGNIYTKAELMALREVCNENDLLFFLDGARLGAALTCDENDVEMWDLANLTDVFYIGGTKNGALLGEALVIIKEDLKKDFSYLIKQRGAMMAKGFLMGIQFEELFRDDLYYKLAKHSNDMASILAKAIRDRGYSFYARPETNQLFPILPNSLIDKLSEEFLFMIDKEVDEEHSVIRLVTSWATSADSVEKFCKAISD